MIIVLLRCLSRTFSYFFLFFLRCVSLETNLHRPFARHKEPPFPFFPPPSRHRRSTFFLFHNEGPHFSWSPPVSFAPRFVKFSKGWGSKDPKLGRPQSTMRYRCRLSLLTASNSFAKIHANPNSCPLSSPHTSGILLLQTSPYPCDSSIPLNCPTLFLCHNDLSTCRVPGFEPPCSLEYKLLRYLPLLVPTSSMLKLQA